jgi:multidrug efflux pump subunit AcrB
MDPRKLYSIEMARLIDRGLGEAPPPFGSSQRTIVVHADSAKLRAYNMSPDEVVRAVGSGNIISPSGNVRIGDLMPIVPVNSVVSDIK